MSGLVVSWFDNNFDVKHSLLNFVVFQIVSYERFSILVNLNGSWSNSKLEAFIGSESDSFDELLLAIMNILNYYWKSKQTLKLEIINLLSLPYLVLYIL